MGRPCEAIRLSQLVVSGLGSVKPYMKYSSTALTCRTGAWGPVTRQLQQTFVHVHGAETGGMVLSQLSGCTPTHTQHRYPTLAAGCPSTTCLTPPHLSVVRSRLRPCPGNIPLCRERHCRTLTLLFVAGCPTASSASSRSASRNCTKVSDSTGARWPAGSRNISRSSRRRGRSSSRTVGTRYQREGLVLLPPWPYCTAATSPQSGWPAAAAAAAAVARKCIKTAPSGDRPQINTSRTCLDGLVFEGQGVRHMLNSS